MLLKVPARGECPEYTVTRVFDPSRPFVYEIRGELVSVSLYRLPLSATSSRYGNLNTSHAVRPSELTDAMIHESVREFIRKFEPNMTSEYVVQKSDAPRTDFEVLELDTDTVRYRNADYDKCNAWVDCECMQDGEFYDPPSEK